MSDKLSRVYELLVDEEDERVCKNIDNRACREVPGNFFLILLTQALTKLGDALANTKTVLPWVLSSMGAPAFLTGLLVPIREAFSMLPQLIIGAWVQGFRLRKWFFVLGCVVQGMSVAMMAVTAYFVDGIWGGALILALVLLFSLARSLCSVSSKDVLGKTIPKTRRGTLSGYSASIAGLVTVGLGVTIYFDVANSFGNYSLLLLIASACWFIASCCYGTIKEFSREAARENEKSALANLGLIREDDDFRRFVLTRCLLMSSGLAAPYFIVIAQQQSSQNAAVALGLFIIIDGLAGLLSGAIWGRLADWSSKRVLFMVAILMAILCFVASLVALSQEAFGLWILLLLFFALATVHRGVRLGRKTYVVDLAEGNRRTDYVTVSNTVVGVMLLAVGALAAALAQVSIAGVLVFFCLSSCAAVYLSTRLASTAPP